MSIKDANIDVNHSINWSQRLCVCTGLSLEPKSDGAGFLCISGNNREFFAGVDAAPFRQCLVPLWQVPDFLKTRLSLQEIESLELEITAENEIPCLEGRPDEPDVVATFGPCSNCGC